MCTSTGGLASRRSIFREHTSRDELDIQVETDRYIALAQALAYKIGQLPILKLRDCALRKLASNYDFRSLHGQSLDSSPLPLMCLRLALSVGFQGRSCLNSLPYLRLSALRYPQL